MSRNKLYLTITRILCLLSTSIGVYKSDYFNLISFLALMFVTFWVIPGIVMWFMGDKDKYDGEIFVKDKDEEGTNYILRIYEVQNLPNKTKLFIKVKSDEE